MSALKHNHYIDISKIHVCPDCRRTLNEEFIKREALAARWELNRKTLDNWVQAKKGPPPIEISPRITRYRLSDIIAFETRALEAAISIRELADREGK